VANAYYRGRSDLVLLWIDPAGCRLSPLGSWSAANGNLTGGVAEGKFSHIFGPINLDAVLTVTVSGRMTMVLWGQPLPVER
jgi:uncharacterized protein (DUF952 family)